MSLSLSAHIINKSKTPRKSAEFFTRETGDHAIVDVIRQPNDVRVDHVADPVSFYFDSDWHAADFSDDELPIHGEGKQVPRLDEWVFPIPQRDADLAAMEGVGDECHLVIVARFTEALDEEVCVFGMHGPAHGKAKELGLVRGPFLIENPITGTGVDVVHNFFLSVF
jgi:hypothetical protein